MYNLVFSGISARKSDRRSIAHLKSSQSKHILNIVLDGHEVGELMGKNSSSRYIYETPYGCVARMAFELGASFRQIEFFLPQGGELAGKIIMDKKDGTRAEILCRPFDALMLACCLNVPMLAAMEVLTERLSEAPIPKQENPSHTGKEILQHTTLSILRPTGDGNYELLADNLGLNGNLAEQIAEVLQNEFSRRILPAIKQDLSAEQKSEQEKNLAEMLRKMTPETSYKM
jgi:bifunctional DNase/RNase